MGRKADVTGIEFEGMSRQFLVWLADYSLVEATNMMLSYYGSSKVEGWRTIFSKHCFRIAFKNDSGVF